MAETAATEVIPVHSAGGTLTVSGRVVEKVAAHVAAQVAGVVTTNRALTTKGYPSVHSEIGGGRARIRVEIAVAWPLPAATTATRVRDAVASAVGEYAGVTADRVDVVVAAVAAADEAPRRMQ